MSKMNLLAELMTELEKRGEVLSADDKSKQIKPEVEETGNKPMAGIEPGTDGPSKELKPKEATEQAGVEVKVQEVGNKPLSSEKKAGEADNVRKDLKPLEAAQASAEKVKEEVSGNKPVAASTPGEQKKVEEPAEKKAKVLSATDKPVNTPKEITAEGSETATLSNDDSRKATESASTAVGKVTSEFTMDRGDNKGTDPSAVKTDRGSQRAQDPAKFASVKKASLLIGLGSLIKIAVAKSKSQQRLFGLVHAVQKGEQKAPSKEVAEMAKDIKPKAVTDYAETKQKGLPEKKATSFKQAVLKLCKRADAYDDNMRANVGKNLKSMTNVADNNFKDPSNLEQGKAYTQVANIAKGTRHMIENAQSKPMIKAQSFKRADGTNALPVKAEKPPIKITVTNKPGVIRSRMPDDKSETIKGGSLAVHSQADVRNLAKLMLSTGGYGASLGATLGAIRAGVGKKNEAGKRDWLHHISEGAVSGLGTGMAVPAGISALQTFDTLPKTASINKRAALVTAIKKAVAQCPIEVAKAKKAKRGKAMAKLAAYLQKKAEGEIPVAAEPPKEKPKEKSMLRKALPWVAGAAGIGGALYGGNKLMQLGHDAAIRTNTGMRLKRMTNDVPAAGGIPSKLWSLLPGAGAPVGEAMSWNSSAQSQDAAAKNALIAALAKATRKGLIVQ